MTEITYQLPEDYKALKDMINRIQESGTEVSVSLTKGKKRRTLKQNASLWKWLTIMADGLNERGIDHAKTLEILNARPKIDIMNTKDSLYVNCWLPIQRAIYPEKEGSSQLTTQEIQAVYEAMNKYFGQELGVSASWPDKFGG